MGSPQMEQNFHGTGFGHVSGPFGGGNAWPQVPHQYLGATLGRSCVILGIILLLLLVLVYSALIGQRRRQILGLPVIQQQVTAVASRG